MLRVQSAVVIQSSQRLPLSFLVAELAPATHGHPLQSFHSPPVLFAGHHGQGRHWDRWRFNGEISGGWRGHWRAASVAVHLAQQRADFRYSPLACHHTKDRRDRVRGSIESTLKLRNPLVACPAVATSELLPVSREMGRERVR